MQQDDKGKLEPTYSFYLYFERFTESNNGAVFYRLGSALLHLFYPYHILNQCFRDFLFLYCICTV